MISYQALLPGLREDNRNKPLGLLIYTADQLLIWWNAKIDVAHRGEVLGDKVNPNVKVAKDAANLLFRKALGTITKEKAIRYLEDMMKETEDATHGNGNKSGSPEHNDDTDPAAIPLDGGGDGANDRSVFPLHGVHERKKVAQGRKRGKSAIPEHLRPPNHKGRVDADED